MIEEARKEEHLSIKRACKILGLRELNRVKSSIVTFVLDAFEKRHMLSVFR